MMNDKLNSSPDSIVGYYDSDGQFHIIGEVRQVETSTEDGENSTYIENFSLLRDSGSDADFNNSDLITEFQTFESDFQDFSSQCLEFQTCTFFVLIAFVTISVFRKVFDILR